MSPDPHGVILRRRCFTSVGARFSVLPGLLLIALDGFGCRPKEFQMALDGTRWPQMAQMAPHCGSRWHQMLPECLESKGCSLNLDFCFLSSGAAPDCSRWPRYFQISPDGSICFQVSQDDHTELLSGEVVLLARAVALVCYLD